MYKVELSVCGERIPPELLDVLDIFTKKSPLRNQVEVHLLQWDEYKQELMNMAIYKRGVEVSQVGAPLVNDLVAMNALRPFSSHELAMLGGEPAFSPVAWQSSQRVQEGKIWAIPWIADPYTILYWRDMLDAAGIDEQIAFRTFGQMDDTLQRLQSNGVATPLVLITGQRHGIIHDASSWVWGAGGDFVSDDGKKALILQPEALKGFRAYFGSYRYMPREGQPLVSDSAYRFFSDRKSAVTYGNILAARNILLNVQPDLHPNLGVALPPGSPLIGGSSLVVWGHTLHDEAAINLVRFLTSREAQAAYCFRMGYLPVRLDVLGEPPYSTNPVYRGFIQALHNGRPFPLTKMGGLLEDKLGSALHKIWMDIIANPEIQLDATIERALTPIVRQFEQWVG
jgi:multiple sugar transport system substrate-binding protein